MAAKLGQEMTCQDKKGQEKMCITEKEKTERHDGTVQDTTKQKGRTDIKNIIEKNETYQVWTDNLMKADRDHTVFFSLIYPYILFGVEQASWM